MEENILRLLYKTKGADCVYESRQREEFNGGKQVQRIVEPVLGLNK